MGELIECSDSLSGELCIICLMPIGNDGKECAISGDSGRLGRMQPQESMIFPMASLQRV